MSNELSLSASYQYLKNGANLQAGVVSLIIDSEKAVKAVKTIGTGDLTLDLGDGGTIQYVLFHNLENTLIESATAPIVTTVGTPGSATWEYKIIAYQVVDSNGRFPFSAAGATGTVSSGNATLTGTDYNYIKWLPVTGAASYDVVRITSGGTPATTGYIANVLATSANFADGYYFTLDTGVASDNNETYADTTPYDFTISIGSDGALYPIKFKGGEGGLMRWNDTDIHAIAVNPANMEYTLTLI